MCKLLSEWQPSIAAVELIKLNGIEDAQIQKSIKGVGDK